MHKPASAPEGASTPPLTRCRIGDLVVVTLAPGLPEVLGAVGKVVRSDSLTPGKSYLGAYKRFSNYPHWVVQFDRTVPCMANDPVTGAQWKTTSNFVTFCDAFLRPLRDGDGADETLTWADTPTTERVPA